MPARPENSAVAAEMTPKGPGGIAVIHLAGPLAVEILQKHFFDKKLLPAEPPIPGKIRYGFIASESGEIADEVIVAALDEELFEVNCHGGRFAVEAVLDLFAKAGARRVAAGEMLEKYGALKGRDKIQRAAYAHLLEAKSARAAAHLLAQFNGALSQALREIRAAVEEGAADRARRMTAELLETAAYGVALTTPPRVIIAGAPNCGKSSLLNALLSFKRAIVSAQPGTTRDVVGATTLIDGVAFEFHDTAGLREAASHPEMKGVERAKEAIESADLVIFVFDLAASAGGEETADISRLVRAGRRVIACLNKTDLADEDDIRKARSAVEKSAADAPICETSCLTGAGIDELRSAVYAACIGDVAADVPAALVFTREQRAALERLLALLGAPPTAEERSDSSDVSDASDGHTGDSPGRTFSDEARASDPSRPPSGASLASDPLADAPLGGDGPLCASAERKRDCLAVLGGLL